MKYKDLTPEEVKIIKDFVEINESDFRIFTKEFLSNIYNSSKPPYPKINAEEMAYEFCKPLLRDKKISDLLSE